MDELLFCSTNPFDASVTQTFDFFDIAGLDPLLEKLGAMQGQWQKTGITYRLSRIELLGNLLEAQHEALARLIVQEVGKTFAQAKREVEKSIRCCAFYAHHTPQLLEQVAQANVRFMPLGVVFGIMPWNYPLWQIIRFVVPVLAMGNAVLIKPPPNAPKVALLLEKIMAQALEQQVYCNCFLSITNVPQVIAHDVIKGVSLTGSVEAGKAVAKLAGSCLKKCVLELGGTDPFIVCADASIEKSVTVGMSSRLQNNGQTCIAAKRFLVHRSIYEAFEATLLQKLAAIQIGDPLDLSTDLGPQARLDLKEKLDWQVSQSIDDGALKRFELSLPAHCQHGFFYPPTVLKAPHANALCMRDEMFGPVFVLYAFDDDKQALKIANNTQYGLGATVMTASSERADFFIEGLEFGNIAVNHKLSSSVERPFGGVKSSGFGRELGVFGLIEFCNAQAVVRPSVTSF